MGAFACNGPYASGGRHAGEKRIRRLMRTGHLQVRRRRRCRVTTDSGHARPVARDHLARRLAVAAPNRVWAADITVLPTGTGWTYLAVVLDLYARRIVGWAVDTTLETRLVITAVTRALVTRRVPPGLIHHSDRGSQYASATYQALLTAHRVQPSMSRVGNCWDVNARRRRPHRFLQPPPAARIDPGPRSWGVFPSPPSLPTLPTPPSPPAPTTAARS
jgi:transposase InsO family protein